MTKLFSCIYLLFLIPFLSNGQVTNTSAITGIENDTVLKPFFAKLAQLQKGDSAVLNIVHIGDSHIQADFLTSVMRTSFQQDFGNAGRGLVFPYHVAASNGPGDYVSSSTGIWQSRRAIMPAPYLPIGIMGFGLQSQSSLASITMDTRDQLSRHITLFAQNSNAFLNAHLILNDSIPADTLHTQAIDVTRYKPSVNFNRFTVQFNTNNTNGYNTDFYGAFLTNGHKGVTYNSIGVNGIDFAHYNQNQNFFRQLSYIHPDLIIVSLGTNDAFARDFNSDDFNTQVSTFFQLIHLYMPGTSILIIAPGDHLLYRRGGNPRVPLACDVLKQYALNNGCAFWNFYSAMGGLGSMRQYIRKGMGQYDGIHFTRAGYEWEAQLLYGVFKDSYNKYTTH